MPDDAPTVTLREAADVLRYWLRRLDRDGIGMTAACHIDLAVHLLNEEAETRQSRSAGPPLAR
jgi:hypothetical protein